MSTTHGSTAEPAETAETAETTRPGGEAQTPTLPARGRLLLAAIGVAAMTLGALALSDAHPISYGAAVLALGMTLGELLRVDLPQRGAGNASFGLGDAALAAGLLLLHPGDIVIGVAGGMLLIQLVERVALVKFTANFGQYLGGAAAAALLLERVAPGRVELGPWSAAGLVAAMLVFLIINIVIVAGMISVTADVPFMTVVRSLAPTGALLAMGDSALAIIAVALLGTSPWVIPGLIVPLALLHYASRQAVSAQIDRGRSEAFADVEHLLSTLDGRDGILATIEGAAETVLGCGAITAVDGWWPEDGVHGARRCPLDGALDEVLVARGQAIGLDVDHDVMAIGMGEGVVFVAVQGEAPLGADLEPWIRRLGRAGRVHLARAAASTALLGERATLAAVVHGVGDGIVMLDDDAAIALWNPAMARLSGLPARDVLGKEITTVLGEGPWTEAGVHDVAQRSADAIWRVSVAETTDEHPDQGEMTVLAIHDVTAERRAAQAREDMLGIVSHELRTPLTPILASAQMLKSRFDRLSDDARVHLVDTIEQRAKHLTRLIDDLLLVGQLSGDTSRPRIHATPVDVARLVTDTVDAVLLARPDRHIEVDVPAAATTSTDPVRLQQVVDNLVDNACKFSSADDVVAVRLARTDDQLVLTVSDTGRGIPPSQLDRVFDQFARVEDPLVMETSGAGLGLFIVKQLVDALGGRIDLASRLGIGTTATVTLPLRDAPADTRPTPAPASSLG